jgi:hypothetical protein
LPLLRIKQFSCYFSKLTKGLILHASDVWGFGSFSLQ